MDDLFGVQKRHGLDDLGEVVGGEFVALQAHGQIVADVVYQGEHVAALAEFDDQVQVLLVLEGLREGYYPGVF